MRDAELARDCGGFSLLELIMVLFIVSILAAVMAPLAFQFTDDVRESATREEMRIINRAIVGDPAAAQYGYVGDMGSLPGSLADLNTKPAGADDYTSSGRVNGVGIGWNGPYLNIGYSTGDYLQDGWGRDYVYNNSTGQLTSLGSDGLLGTNDDIVIPPYSADISGDVSVTVSVYDTTPGGLTTVDSTCATVDVYYSSGGTEASVSANWNAGEGVFKASGLHQGVHAVEVTGINDCAGGSAKANAVVFKGTASLTVFLGSFDLP